MKRKNSLILALILALALTLTALCSCTAKIDADKLWESAVYKEDTELGDGDTTLDVIVKVGERSVKLTLHTNAENVADALSEQGLLGGYDSQYGLYVETVNGIDALYENDKSYWTFLKNGEYVTVSADKAYISDGEQYEFVYTK